MRYAEGSQKMTFTRYEEPLGSLQHPECKRIYESAPNTPYESECRGANRSVGRNHLHRKECISVHDGMYGRNLQHVSHDRLDESHQVVKVGYIRQIQEMTKIIQQCSSMTELKNKLKALKDDNLPNDAEVVKSIIYVEFEVLLEHLESQIQGEYYQGMGLVEPSVLNDVYRKRLQSLMPTPSPVSRTNNRGRTHTNSHHDGWYSRSMIARLLLDSPKLDRQSSIIVPEPGSFSLHLEATNGKDEEENDVNNDARTMVPQLKRKRSASESAMNTEQNDVKKRKSESIQPTSSPRTH